MARYRSDPLGQWSPNPGEPGTTGRRRVLWRRFYSDLVAQIRYVGHIPRIGAIASESLAGRCVRGIESQPRHVSCEYRQSDMAIGGGADFYPLSIERCGSWKRSTWVHSRRVFVDRTRKLTAQF